MYFEAVRRLGIHVLVDTFKNYEISEIRKYIKLQDSAYCILPEENAKDPWESYYYQYKERQRTLCGRIFFNKLKQFRFIATRYEKLFSFFSFVLLASTIILLK